MFDAYSFNSNFDAEMNKVGCCYWNFCSFTTIICMYLLFSLEIHPYQYADSGLL